MLDYSIISDGFAKKNLKILGSNTHSDTAAATRNL